MARPDQTGTSRRARATRSTGFVPLVLAVVSAAALTGAAVYTVDRASCGDPAQYIRHDNHVELVGGCVDGSELPATTPQQPAEARGPAVVPGSFRQ
ncbi:hypothetical protein [Amycolatopsis sp. H20-H5]|uniref:hypothetical protein n=1 Tax=Amycolatopsis sp. H20-H5 TaxID=3046309 RepID=UPI002DBA582F|nr:hypothetical protein [Amycolatopsis sp. H20-H5]MEC3979846.1 hypothetical protein [Amycolatopsis sp. H20-H5]